MPLLGPSVRTAVTTLEGLRAALCCLLVGCVNIAVVLLGWIVWLLSLFASPENRKQWQFESWHSPLRRFASRTTILRRTLDDRVFNGMQLRALRGRRPLLIISAAELRTGSAFYFSPEESGSWRFGKLARTDVTLAEAVTASAAYPLFLPAVDESLPFDRRDGSRVEERVVLTDGGVYDNLGLAPLWPGRDPSVSLNVQAVDTIICCRAGYGLRQDPPTQFLMGCLKSAFACVQDRAQNGAMNRLFDLKRAGVLRGFVLPYLGMDDSRLKFPPADLVTREEAYAYPTDFSAMKGEWVDKLSRRGEQLTRALVEEHAPELIRGTEVLSP